MSGLTMKQLGDLEFQSVMETRPPKQIIQKIFEDKKEDQFFKELFEKLSDEKKKKFAKKFKPFMT